VAPGGPMPNPQCGTRIRQNSWLPAGEGRGGGAEPCGTDRESVDRGGGRSSLTAAAVVWIGSWWLGVREREEGSKLREVVLMGSK
jgi:hypothetical protein